MSERYSRPSSDRFDQAAGDALAARLGHHRQAAEIEIVVHQLHHDATEDAAVPLREDGATGVRQLVGDAVGGLAKGARLGLELAAILLEGCGDGGRDGRGVGRRRGAQDKGVAHGGFLA